MLNEPIRLSLDHLLKIGKRHRTITPDHAPCSSDTGAVDQQARGSMRACCGGIGLVADDRNPIDLGRDAFGQFCVEITDRYSGTCAASFRAVAAPSPDAPAVTMAA
jgi:hypothetical protein